MSQMFSTLHDVGINDNPWYMSQWRNRLWWKFMPGKEIIVKWPKGWVQIMVDSKGRPITQEVDSADPNDHYRPWMESHVGKQGWDWDWGLNGNDVESNTLTIKFRIGKTKLATIAAMRWA